VFVTHICLGEINDGRMVQEKREVRNQQRIAWLADGTLSFAVVPLGG
jgi:hypothetical protein